MSIPLTARINTPTDGPEFERQCCRVFSLEYKHPGMTVSAPSKQYGVDIFGYRNSNTTKPVGVQCKANPNVSLTEIRKAFSQALDFKPRLTEWVVATTSTSRSELQELARQLTLESQKESQEPIEVRIYDWRQMEQIIISNPESLGVFDPFFSPFIAKVKADVLQGIEEVGVRMARRLSHQRPLPFINGEALFYQYWEVGLQGQPEKIPIIFDHKSFFYANILPASRSSDVSMSRIETHIGDAYYELPPSGQEGWPPRGVGDYVLFARNKLNTNGSARVLQDGVGFYRNGEAFIFQSLKGLLDIERLALCIGRTLEIQQTLWRMASILQVGVCIEPGDHLRFVMGNVPIARILPAQHLTSSEYSTSGNISIRIFSDLLEAGGLNSSQSADALAKMLREGISNGNEYLYHLQRKKEESRLHALDI